MLGVLDGNGLDEYRMLEWDAVDEQETGVTAEQDAMFADVAATGAFPTFVRVVERSDFDLDLDEQFEFGLRHLLDGFAASLPGLRLR